MYTIRQFANILLNLLAIIGVIFPLVILYLGSFAAGFIFTLISLPLFYFYGKELKKQIKEIRNF